MFPGDSVVPENKPLPRPLSGMYSEACTYCRNLLNIFNGDLLR